MHWLNPSVFLFQQGDYGSPLMCQRPNSAVYDMTGLVTQGLPLGMGSGLLLTGAFAVFNLFSQDDLDGPLMCQ